MDAGQSAGDSLFERAEQIQSGVGLKSMRHYLLFWQRAYPGPLGQQDLVNALEYVARFRPALGFSLNDAKNAEYVTIVGGESGISSRGTASTYRRLPRRTHQRPR
ncbi:MAG: hypothetical protein R2911_28515 [Caldilineaceae bacterium]